MKKVNMLLQFLSKKGVLILGIIIGLLVAFVTAGAIVHAEESTEESGEKEHAGSITWTDIWTDGNNVGASIVQNVRGSGRICLYYTGGTDGTSNSGFILMSDKKFTVSAFSSIYNTTSIKESYLYNGKYQIYDAGSVTSFTSSGFLLFSDREKAFAYVDGTISEEDLLKYSNWDEYINGKDPMDKYSLGYNSDIPYYDSCSLSVNQNQSATYNAKMSATQQSKTKVVTSDDKEDEKGPDEDAYKTGYKAYAIYLDSGTFGGFNSMVMEMGLDKMIQMKKLDDVIKFDVSGRLTVKKLLSFGSGASSSSGTLFDAVGLSLLTPYESKDSDCPLVAVEIDSLNSNLVPSFQRTLNADKYLDVSTNKTSNSSAASHTHVLIGYYATNIVYRDDAEGNHECGNLSYSYQWIYDSFRKRYGSGTNVMSNSGFNEGDAVLEPDLSYGYDRDGNMFTNSDFSQSGGLTTANLLDFIKSGFGLLSNNGTVGFIALAASFFNSIPVAVWMLVYFAMSVNIVVIVFKVLRGM